MSSSEEPILAQIVGPPPPPRGAGYAVLGCLGVGALLVLIVMGSFVYLVYKMVESSRIARAAEQQRLVAIEQLADGTDPRAELIAGFSASELGIGPAEKAEFDAIFTAALDLNEETVADVNVQQYFDPVVYGQRCANSEAGKKSPYSLQSGLRANRSLQPFSWLEGPFQITHVKKSTSGDEAVIYGYSSGSELRWLAMRNDGVWKLVDFHPCDRGRWHSELHASQALIAQNQSLEWKSFETACDEVERAIELALQGKRDEAATVLQGAGRAAMTSDLHDARQMQLVYGWSHVYRPKDYLKVAQGFRNPDRWPGAYSAQAMAHQQLKNWDECLAAATKFRDLVGPTVTISRTMANCYEELHRPQEALEAWQHVLRAIPEDPSGLAGLAHNSPEDGTALLDHVKRQSDPVALATKLAATLYGDVAEQTLEQLIELVQSRSPDSVAYWQLRGELEEHRENQEAAAENFLKARQKATDLDVAKNMLYRVFDTYISRGKYKEMVAESPDRVLALKYLADDYFLEGDFGIPRSAMEAAVATCREAAGVSADVLYYEGKLLLEKKEYAAAEKRLQEALSRLPKTDPEEEDWSSTSRTGVINNLRHAFIGLKRYRDAYENWDGGTKEVFNSVMLDIDLKKDRSGYEQMLQLHRAKEPSDQQLDFYQADLLKHDKRYLAAWEKVRGVMVDETNYSLKYRVQGLQHALLTFDEVPLERYRELADVEAAFTRLAGLLTSQSKWTRLEQLARLELQTRPASLSAKAWLAETYFQRGEFELTIRELQPLTAQLIAQANEKSLSTPDGAGSGIDRLLRSLCQRRRHGEALEIAKRLQSDGDVRWISWIQANSGDFAAATDTAKNGDQRSLSHTLYHDEDFSPALFSEAALPIRLIVPPSLPHATTREWIEMLLASPLELKEEDVTREARAALGEQVQVSQVTGPETPEGTSAWRITKGNDSWLLVTGKKVPPKKEDDGYVFEFENEQLTAARDNFQAWISLISLQPCDKDKTSLPLLKLITQLAGEHGLAIHFGAENHALPMSDAVRSVGDPLALATLIETGEAYFGSMIDVEEHDLESRHREVRRAWRKFIKACDGATPEKPARVRIEQQLYGLRESLWFTVLRVDKPSSRWQTASVIATPEAASNLWPHVKPGEPFELDQYQIVEVMGEMFNDK